MLPASTRFSQCSSSRSSWLIAIRSILQPCGCQEELSTWLKAELLIWPRHEFSEHAAVIPPDDILRDPVVGRGAKHHYAFSLFARTRSFSLYLKRAAAFGSDRNIQGSTGLILNGPMPWICETTAVFAHPKWAIAFG